MQILVNNFVSRSDIDIFSNRHFLCLRVCWRIIRFNDLETMLIVCNNVFTCWLLTNEVSINRIPFLIVVVQGHFTKQYVAFFETSFMREFTCFHRVHFHPNLPSTVRIRRRKKYPSRTSLYRCRSSSV